MASFRLPNATPSVDRLAQSRRTIRQRNFRSLPRRRIPRADDFQHYASIFAGGLRCFLAAHATPEVPHLVRETIIPKLVENRIAPAAGGGRLLDGVAVPALAISG